MSIYCDLCTSLLTSKEDVQSRTTYEFEDGQTADLCRDCTNTRVGDLPTEQIRAVIDTPR